MGMLEKAILDQLRYEVLFTAGSMSARTLFALIVVVLGAVVLAAAAVRHWRRAHTRLAVVVTTELVCLAAFVAAASAFGAMSTDTVELSLVAFIAYYYIVVGLSRALDGVASVVGIAPRALNGRKAVQAP